MYCRQAHRRLNSVSIQCLGYPRDLTVLCDGRLHARFLGMYGFVCPECRQRLAVAASDSCATTCCVTATGHLFHSDQMCAPIKLNQSSANLSVGILRLTLGTVQSRPHRRFEPRRSSNRITTLILGVPQDKMRFGPRIIWVQQSDVAAATAERKSRACHSYHP